MPAVSTNQMPVACFAPELTDADVAAYEAAITAMPVSEAKDYMLRCLNCVKAWWDLPVSSRQDVERYNITHGGAAKTFAVIPLETGQVTAIWDATPYSSECAAMATTLLELPTGTISEGLQDKVCTDGLTRKIEKITIVDQAAYDLRNMAMHLLWYATELSNDREPITVASL